MYRYRCGIAWRDASEVFGPRQTIWTWHRRPAGDGTWYRILGRLLAVADAAEMIAAIPRLSRICSTTYEFHDSPADDHAPGQTEYAATRRTRRVHTETCYGAAESAQ
ncbi:transposase [Prescottella agglutinans]|uniref:Transposase n=1 Tax=Prescottella agglutinans TaxID=1644129 RepID=A0ABT6MLD6_9NOCA|nr:transposase [Prescottella agglutinans]